jgi:hypothetical protein
MKLTLRLNYDTLIPNLDGKILNHFVMLKKTSDNFLCIYLKKNLRFMNVGSTARHSLCIVVSETSLRNNACLYVSSGSVTPDNSVY